MKIQKKTKLIVITIFFTLTSLFLYYQNKFPSGTLQTCSISGSKEVLSKSGILYEDINKDVWYYLPNSRFSQNLTKLEILALTKLILNGTNIEILCND